jgi:hypothetical protein
MCKYLYCNRWRESCRWSPLYEPYGVLVRGRRTCKHLYWQRRRNGAVVCASTSIAIDGANRADGALFTSRTAYSYADAVRASTSTAPACDGAIVRASTSIAIDGTSRAVGAQFVCASTSIGEDGDGAFIVCASTSIGGDGDDGANCVVEALFTGRTGDFKGAGAVFQVCDCCTSVCANTCTASDGMDRADGALFTGHTVNFKGVGTVLTGTACDGAVVCASTSIEYGLGNGGVGALFTDFKEVGLVLTSGAIVWASTSSAFLVEVGVVFIASGGGSGDGNCGVTTLATPLGRAWSLSSTSQGFDGGGQTFPPMKSDGCYGILSWRHGWASSKALSGSILQDLSSATPLELCSTMASLLLPTPQPSTSPAPPPTSGVVVWITAGSGVDKAPFELSSSMPTILNLL